MRENDVVRLKREYSGFPAGMEGTVVCENDLRMLDIEFMDDDENYYDPILVPTEYLELVSAYHPETIKQQLDSKTTNDDK